MTARWILLALLPLVAGIALFQSRRLSAIIGMGLFSFLLAAAYMLLKAPDVAITEATIGAALVTAIYILAIRRTGRLSVVADEVPGLISREGDHIEGLEFEILNGFAREQGLDLSVQFVPLRRIRWLVAHGEADIGAGGLVASSYADQAIVEMATHLPTGVFAFSESDAPLPTGQQAPDYEGYFSELPSHGRHGTLSDAVKTLDLARVLSLGRSGVSLHGLNRAGGMQGYTFLLARQRRELRRDFTDYLERIEASGQLQDLVERYFA